MEMDVVMIKDISSLPDYAALKKLALALWQQESSYHGAAVMVGAGFSRCAASSGDANKKLPLWNDFSKRLADELGSNSADPLRLAEEYCAYFGKQALDDLVKKEINDLAWVPGELYKSLLELPWSEVLTTNWDTLLERAATQVYQPVYNVVSKQEDLSSARSPRIVKLHGTIDITKGLIFTQEDYRKYPQNNAAFVNFARQVFIENELCLLGFSGDDPNFLQWAGWVRDHLAGHSRRIYLVGALGLNAAKRKYLESINVAPIDLKDLVSDYDESHARHLQATKIFFQALQDLKPKKIENWEPIKANSAEGLRAHRNANYAAKLFTEKLPSLEKDRESYPDWLVCPSWPRLLLKNRIADPWPNLENLSEMTEFSKAKLLYEITWSSQITFEAIPSWLVKELLALCTSDESSVLSKNQQLEIALSLLKNTCWMDGAEAEEIAKITSEIIQNGNKYWPESSNELAYHNAIVVRDRFDYFALEKYVEEINSNDPIWKIRKASLLAEIGQFNKGKELVEEAHKDLLRQYRNDRNSIHVLSRLAWAHWLVCCISDKEFNDFSSDYRNFKCDPWDHIKNIRDCISRKLNSQNKKQIIEPLFEPGHYTDNSRSKSISNELHPVLLLEGISNTVGMPIFWNDLNFLAESAANLAELNDLDNRYRFSLAIRSANHENSPVLNKLFSRLNIACFLQDDVNILINQCTSAIKYWTEKREEKPSDASRFSIDRLRVFIEVLARLSVRATLEQAKQIFRLAVSLGKKPGLQHIWLLELLEKLMTNSIKSISKSHQYEVLLDALSFPLLQETDYDSSTRHWPNPIIEFPGDRTQNPALDRRIDEIIDSISPCLELSALPLMRLLPLLKKNFLDPIECQKIGEKIWGFDPDYQSIPSIGLYPHAFLEFPAPDSVMVKSSVRKSLFEKQKDQIFDSSFLAGLAGAARTNSDGELPKPDQAEFYFKELVAWRKNEAFNDPLGFVEQVNRGLEQSIGKAIAYAIVPALGSEALEQDNFDKLLAFHNEVDAPDSIIALSHFAANNDAFAAKVEKLIRQSLQSKTPRKVASSAFALLKWREIQASPATERLTSRLVYLAGAHLSAGISALLNTARILHDRDYLSSSDIELLTESVPWVFDSTAYESVSPVSREAISISLIRAECVRLSQSILSRSESENIELLRVINEAKRDPLPEVRFALDIDK